jgi:anaerobic magnesium-protoporphyrin IX monomethyl ester cyclase
VVDVLLVNPPYLEVYGKLRDIYTTPPLGLLYIASILEKNGISVEVLDTTPQGVGFEELKKQIAKKAPKIIGITTTTPALKSAVRTAEIAKELDPLRSVVLGGPHATILPHQTLQSFNAVDVVIRGEGEYTMLEFAKCILKHESFKNIRGISYRDETNNIRNNDSCTLIQNLDDVPFPARHLINIKKYRQPPQCGGRQPYTTVITSRGCPHNCIFCSSRMTFGRKVRLRSVKNVIEELEQVAGSFGVREIEFVDDTFTLYPKRVKEICDAIIKRKLDITWMCNARVDRINRETLVKMRRAGCHMIFFGVESGVQEILNASKKGITIEQVKKAFSITKKANIRTLAYFMIGLPGETLETAKTTIAFAKKLAPDYVTFSIATPYPGTEFYDMATEKGWLKTNNWFDYRSPKYSSPVISTETLSSEDLLMLSKRAYMEFYVRPMYMLKRLFQIRSLEETRMVLRGMGALRSFLGTKT